LLIPGADARVDARTRAGLETGAAFPSTTSHFDPNLLNGVMVLDHPGSISRMPADLGLYYPETEKEAVQEEPTTLKLIPYYAWANRGPASMQVRIPSSRA